MDPVTAKLMSAAGAAADRIYVDDVFSTYLHAGVNSSSTINNGIDLSGEGGLVWVKTRNNTYSHFLFDTERGTTKTLSSNLDNAEFTESKGVTAFNSNGFNIGGSGGDIGFNGSGTNYCYWTFRKAPGFFDVVTYTGDGSDSRAINHNLGSVPGMIIIKSASSTYDWVVYHRSTGATQKLGLNLIDAAVSENGNFGGLSPTSTTFGVGYNATNENNATYVAYIFAHDEQSFGDAGNESIIKCESYTGNGSNTGPVINVGFEPQFLIIKNTGAADNWYMFDNMRGVVNGGEENILFANTNTAEASNSFNAIHFTSTGFAVDNNSGGVNSNNVNYIYIAIRRPHKPPSAGTDVLALKMLVGSNSTQTVSVPGAGVTDMTIIKKDTGTSGQTAVPINGARLLGPTTVRTHDSQAGTTGVFNTSVNVWDQMVGTELRSDTDLNKSGYNFMNYQFTRKPGVFDVVAYSGSSSAQSIAHNLGSQPGFIIVKCISDVRDWRGYHQSSGATKYFVFNDDTWALAATTIWNDTEPTSTHFTVGTSTSTNGSGRNFIAYLFATLPGVSKVGSYTGTGNNINVDCGFTAGARFVLIKRFDVDSFGDWYVFDAVHGINSGNDPYITLNKEELPVTNTDYIDPLNAGFTITSSAPTALNASGGTYLFLAIA